MRILVLHEKHIDRYVALTEEPGSVDAVLEAVLRERIEDGNWFINRGELTRARTALAGGPQKVRQFMTGRKCYEYEGWGVSSVETLRPDGTLGE